MDESVLLDLLECPVCLERLDAAAKVLPCQHTFCRRCLQGILGSRGELRCPECRTLVECGVDELPSNILLVRLLDGIKQRPRRAGPPAGPGGAANGTAGAAAARAWPERGGGGGREPGAPGPQPQRAQAKSALVRSRRGASNLCSGLTAFITAAQRQPAALTASDLRLVHASGTNNVSVWRLERRARPHGARE
ncbi:E3 ubiquitin-protein ligase SH3RF1 [Liparis tanakae]|uniref:E3 ubiquitin-protein ligase SH3RF1 n=1 Tax=Liparis tanakae TaxID=230148 RepID=A0A4Z2FNZ1_9TELE|nr:E3 ubiquitin-protein ligase SH3RF1 [Liparis tanakae]